MPTFYSPDVILAAEALIADYCKPYGDDERPHLKDLPKEAREDLLREAYVALDAVAKLPAFEEVLKEIDASLETNLD